MSEERERERARELAHKARQTSKGSEWFESFYRKAETSKVKVPWDDGVPNPHLVRWLDARGEVSPGTRALDIGCGYGDNTVELGKRGYSVMATDISKTAVARAKSRVADYNVEAQVQDILKPPTGWRERFDLVVEIYTMQVMPPPERARLVSVLPQLLRPGGAIVVVCRGRQPSDPLGQFPWPLIRSEVEGIAYEDVELVSFEDFMDDEDPPQRRFLAEFKRV